MAALWFVVDASSASADLASREPTPFDRGSIGIEVAAGSMEAFGFRYFGLGAGVDYYVLDGVAVGLFALHEFGGGPSLNQVKPSLTYVAHSLVGQWPFIPYVGGFYKHWFVGDDYDDVDSLGARAGIYYLNQRFLAGLGVAVEQIVSSCENDCTLVSPDVTLGITF